MKNIYSVLVSIRSANTLLFLLIILFVAGAFIMPMEEKAFEALKGNALFNWLQSAPKNARFWVYGSMAAIILLVINTIFCSIDSVLKKRAGRNLLLIISPQIIHIGFCFMMLAHVVSGFGSKTESGFIYEGEGIKLEQGIDLIVTKISFKNMGNYVADISADLLYKFPDGSIKEERISTNHPSFASGKGVYISDISLYGGKSVLVQISHEPGAIWALIGSIMFSLGTVAFFFLKLKFKIQD